VWHKAGGLKLLHRRVEGSNAWKDQGVTRFQIIRIVHRMKILAEALE